VTAPIEVPCPTCGQPPWHCCTNGAEPCRNPHALRWTQAGTLPGGMPADLTVTIDRSDTLRLNPGGH
jgi:hypothetical protein